jgi:IPT/TIG domain/Putative Ig domain
MSLHQHGGRLTDTPFGARMRLLTMMASFAVAAFAAPAPTLTAISPTAGSTSGGTVVKLTGTNFVSGAKVWFGTNQSPTVTFVNSTTMNAVTPPSTLPGLEGTVSVSMTNPDGQSATYTVQQGGYIYDLPPTVTSVTPNPGPPQGGVTVLINGQYFRSSFRGTQKVPVVLFGANACTGVVFHNNTLLTCTQPAGAPGSTVTVTVTDPDGQVAKLSNGFTYNGGISITGVQPRGGDPAGGTTVTINGTYFLTGASVLFDTLPATSINYVSSQQITAISPAHAAGNVAITVQNPNQGQTATLKSAYNYTLGPIINSASPNQGPISGGTAVTLSGSALDTVTSITFGGVTGTVQSQTPSQLVAVTPPASATGKVDIRVVGPAGPDSLFNGFTYMPDGPPLSIVTQGFDDAYPTVLYSQTLQAAGGSPPYNWSIASGSLPSGLALNGATGVVSGQVAANYNTYNLTFKVTDSGKPPVSAQVPISFNVLFGFQVAPIPKSFFGMTLFSPTNVPTIPWGSLAKGIGVSWPFIEQVKGQYNWTLLDQYVQLAQANGTDIYYTTANMPPWAVPDQSTCSVYPSFPGIFGCTAMVTNIQDWDDFLTALVRRYKGKIKMYELWNEPNVLNTFTGTVQQMVTLTQHFHDIVRTLDSKALILAPSSTDEPYSQAYYAAGGTKDFDVITIHGYPNVGVADVPEAVAGFKSVNTKLLMAQLKLSNKIFWDDESSWGGTNSNSDLQFRAAFASRTLLLHWSIGAQRFYWYSWDSPAWGTLWSPTTGINIATTAYANTYTWMLGATMPTPCSQNGGTTYSAIYTCVLTRPGGYQALAVWDTNEPCSQTGGCPTHPFTLPPGVNYIQYRDIFGNLTPVAGGTVPIGAQPILIENMTAPAAKN